MAKVRYTTPAVIILDSSNPCTINISKRLRPALPAVKMMRFTDPRETWRKLRARRRIEPYVVITDMIGIIPKAKSFICRMNTGYPRAQVILFSGRVTEKEVVQLQNIDSIIDRYVSKNEGIERLFRAVMQCYDNYDKDPVLRSIRLYLSQCSYPSAPFMAIGNKEYSLIDMYWEIVLGTEIGKQAERVWDSLLMKAVMYGRKTEARVRDS